MRTILNISIPVETAAEAKQATREGGFASVSEYFRHLHREEKRRKLVEELDAQRKQFESGKGKWLTSLKDLP